MTRRHILIITMITKDRDQDVSMKGFKVGGERERKEHSRIPPRKGAKGKGESERG